MTFKAIAAALVLLPLLAGAIHHVRPVAGPHAETVAIERIAGAELISNAPADAAQRDARSVNSAVRVAEHISHNDHPQVPEPKVLLLLGLVLLLFGLRRSGKQDRNPP